MAVSALACLVARTAGHPVDPVTSLRSSFCVTSAAGGAGVRTGGFDHVDVPAGGDKPKRRLDRRQFEALPLQEKIGLLLQGTLRFYRGGQEVPATEAMRTAY